MVKRWALERISGGCKSWLHPLLTVRPPARYTSLDLSFLISRLGDDSNNNIIKIVAPKVVVKSRGVAEKYEKHLAMLRIE